MIIVQQTFIGNPDSTNMDVPLLSDGCEGRFLLFFLDLF